MAESRDDIFSPLDGELQDPAFYANLGFKSGLEIHQQLLTEKKLFCHCPAGVYTKDHDAEILRHMRPTLSELGEYDGTALMEFKTKKEIVYLLSRENVCTYEMDDTPPFIINQQALDIGLETALLLRCQIVNELHIIRKQYLDGSIPTGFQRTAIVGVNGCVPFRGRDIRIVQVAVEEDSCREVSNKGHRITFRTDRLNMPLSEVVTAPDMRTPEEVAEACMLLARIARVTGKVRRGSGAARQDVNVSAEGGCRVEIKGVSRIPLIPSLVHNEALRQKRLLGIRDHLRGLGLTKDSLSGGSRRVNELFAKTSVPLLRKALADGLEIRVQVLRGLRRVLRAYVQPGLFFAQELSGRVRVVACLDDPVNLFLRDEDYGLGLARHSWEDRCIGEFIGPTPKEWKRVAACVQASDQDGLVLMWGPPGDTKTAVSEIGDRMAEALEGVPSETRTPSVQGTTDFERILPGPNRMYPDTDLPPVAIDDERIRRIRTALPELPWAREERLGELGLSSDAVCALAVSPYYGLFSDVTASRPGRSRAVLLAWMFTELMKSLRRKGTPVAAITDEDIREIVRLVVEGQLQREGVAVVIDRLARLRAVRSAPASAPLLAAVLEEEFPEIARGKAPLAVCAKDLNGLIEPVASGSFGSEAAHGRFLMGVAMGRYRGVAPGREVAKAVSAWQRARGDLAK